MVRSLRGVRACLGLVALVTLGVLVQGAGGQPLRVSASSEEPPQPQDQSAPPPSDPCSNQYKRKSGRITEPKDSHLPYCGSTGNDLMVSKLGHFWISGSSGNDVIKARGNHQRDDIWGGVGRKDVAYADDFDTVHSDVEKSIPPRRTPAATRRRVDLEFPFEYAELNCMVDATGRHIVFTKEPTMRAADATPQTDWQAVAYTAYLYRWTGTKWEYMTGYQTPWLWDRPPDKQFDDVVPFNGNYWRKFDTRARAKYRFNVSTAGYYRVAIWFHWYSSDAAPVHDYFWWAGAHAGFYDDAEHKHLYCAFP